MSLSTSKTSQGTFNGTLDVTAVEARLTDIQHATKELYCYITFGSGGVKRFLEGETWGKEVFKSQVYGGGGQNPVWNERYTFNLKNMTMESHLNVKVYEKEFIKDDYLGVAKIDLAELLKYDGQGTHYFSLHEKGIFGYGETEKTVGDVGIAVKFHCTEYPCEAGDLKTQVSDAIGRGQQGIHGVPSTQQIPSTDTKLGSKESVGYDPLAREGGHTVGTKGQGIQGQGIQGQGIQGQGKLTQGPATSGPGTSGQGQGTSGQGTSGQGTYGQGTYGQEKLTQGQGFQGQEKLTQGQGIQGQEKLTQGQGTHGQEKLTHGQGIQGKGIQGQEKSTQGQQKLTQGQGNQGQKLTQGQGTQ
jgi:hypothetical protein